ncbi:hypothetical protein ACJMK2_043636 [Sinanodonta woodiana]|uniref:Small EDRK-rich factor-like N-terminal domain-containing protein n=1 Tax=Sinanodonta woodiana TaxID=1069815 RepID=A0ABD3VXI6_SINWO
MTEKLLKLRGNQRELARQKNLKKQQELSKSKAASDKNGNKGLSLEERRQRDADIMRQKQMAAVSGKVEGKEGAGK